MLPALLAAFAVGAAAAPLVSFSPSVLPYSGALLTVTWTGVEAPSSEDLLVVIATTASGPLRPFGFLPVNQSAGWQTGSGSFQFPLVNLRVAAYSFQYNRVSGFGAPVGGLYEARPLP